MRAVPSPGIAGTWMFTECSSAVADGNFRDRLNSVAPQIAAAEVEYTKAAAGPQFHTLPASGIVGGSVTSIEMTSLYQDHVVASKGICRVAYDYLRALPKHGKCPYCGVNIVSALDHYLPKARYAALAVLPINMVGCCSDCNRAKGVKCPVSPETQIIHPYYDNFDDVLWLKAEVSESSPPVVRFFVDGPSEWGEERSQRARHHLNVFKLRSLFTINAGQEMVIIRSQLLNLYNKGGSIPVRQYLSDQAATNMAAFINSWQTATYLALADSTWFCEGGFISIPSS